MYIDTEKWRHALIDNKTKCVDGCYKIDENYEADFIEKLWPKRNTYIDYYNNDVKLTKEMTNIMGKIKRVNDPRMNYNTGNIYVVINGKAYIPETMEVGTSFREHMVFGFTATTDPRYAAVNTMLAIKDVIHNPPATIVFWGDGSKTIVKCQDGEEYDPEKGLTMAFFKRMHDNKGRYFEEIKKWTKQYYEKYPTDSKGVSIEFTAHDWVEMIEKISDTSKLIAEMEKYRAEHKSDNK